jgi:uncharacterized sulfatase
VHNLANDPKYKERMTTYRKALADWQLEIGDKGFIPEYDLAEMFWPDMIQPVTANVSFVKSNETLTLNSNTNGASIGYQTGKQIGTKHWSLYTEPLKLKSKQKIVARAIKIGFMASDITTF